METKQTGVAPQLEMAGVFPAFFYGYRVPAKGGSGRRSGLIPGSQGNVSDYLGHG